MQAGTQLGARLFFVTLLRFERRTYCLEGSCSIQLSYKAIFYSSSSLPSLAVAAVAKKKLTFVSSCVGIARFELATSCSQSRRDNRTTLYPGLLFFWRRRGDSNPRYPNRVRQFSKLLVSATHPPLRSFAISRHCYTQCASQKSGAKVLTFCQPAKFFLFSGIIFRPLISFLPDLQHLLFFSE